MRMGLLKVCYKHPDWDLAQAISTASERILGRARSSARTPWWNPTIKSHKKLSYLRSGVPSGALIVETQ